MSITRQPKFAYTSAGVALLFAATLLTAAAKHGSPFVPGAAFRINASTRIYAGDTPRGQDDEVVRARGIATNNHARIEFLAFTPAPQGVTTDDYLIVSDSGKAFILHAKTGEYTPANDLFGGPAVVALSRITGASFGRGGAGGDSTGGGGAGRRGAGGGGGFPGRGGGGPGGGNPGGGARGARGGRGRGGLGSGFLTQIELLNVSFKVEKLGAGDPIDGHQTQHFRVSTDYTILWGGQDLPAHAVTELWTATLPTQIPNPFEPLIVADQSTDGPLVEYALKLRAARAQIEGTPIKVVTTTTLTGIHDIIGFQSYVGNDPTVDKLTVIQQTAITSIAPSDVDPKAVAVPEPGAN